MIRYRYLTGRDISVWKLGERGTLGIDKEEYITAILVDTPPEPVLHGALESEGICSPEPMHHLFRSRVFNTHDLV